MVFQCTVYDVVNLRVRGLLPARNSDVQRCAWVTRILSSTRNYLCSRWQKPIKNSNRPAGTDRRLHCAAGYGTIITETSINTYA